MTEPTQAQIEAAAKAMRDNSSHWDNYELLAKLAITAAAQVGEPDEQMFSRVLEKTLAENNDQLRAALVRAKTIKWHGTRQRDDLKTCPFCDTKSVQQVRLADNDTNTQYRIGCGNPHCLVEPNTPPFAALKDAEWAWQDRAAAQVGEPVVTGKSGYEYVSTHDEIVAHTIERCAQVAECAPPGYTSLTIAAAIRKLKDAP